MSDQALAAPPARTYVALEHAEKFLAYGRRLGVPVDALLAEYRIDLRRDTNKPGYVPGHIWEAILKIGIARVRQLGEPLPGLLIAERLGIGFTGLWAFVIETSGTFLKAIEKAAEYQKLHTTAVVATPRRRPGYLDILITPHFHSTSVCQHTADWYLAMLALFAQHCCHQVDELVDSVYLCHPAPADPALRQRYATVFNCAVHFNAPENFIRLRASELNRPLITADPALQNVLEQQAQVKLDAYDRAATDLDTHFRQTLRRLIAEGQASKGQLADALGISPRTLQRKLQALGISYQQLLREVRLGEARSLLHRSALSIADIAAQLGFQDPHSFSRWFATETGIAPSSVRRQHHAPCQTD